MAFNHNLQVAEKKCYKSLVQLLHERERPEEKRECKGVCCNL